MRKVLSTRPALRALALAAPVLALSLLFAAPGGAAVVPTGVTAEIDMVGTKFVGPKTVTQGDTLKVVNKSNPKKVGPHTFSLVTKGVIPATKNARKNCFTPKHICLSIAKWHGLNPKTEEISVNPVEVGPEGWGTAGDNAKKGDSWFTEKQGESFEQQVTAAPGDLYFLCAVHPFMKGKVKVVAPTPVPLPAL